MRAHVLGCAVLAAALPDHTQFSVPDLVCAGVKPKRTAVCVGGAARTFGHPVVYRTLKTNVIDALGGIVVPFAYLKLGDDRGTIRDGGQCVTNCRLAANVTATREEVDEGLKHLQISTDNVIIKDTAFVQPPNCPNYGHFRVNGSSENDRSALPEDTRQWAAYKSLQGQLDNRYQCYNMIKRHENTTGYSFDAILYARADLMWPIPFRPFCTFEFDLNRMRQDWTWWIRRGDARKAFEHNRNELYSCKKEFTPGVRAGGTTIERYILNGIDWYHGTHCSGIKHSSAGDLLTGHIVRVPDRRQGFTLCPQFGDAYLLHDKEVMKAACEAILTRNPFNWGKGDEDATYLKELVPLHSFSKEPLVRPKPPPPPPPPPPRRTAGELAALEEKFRSGGTPPPAALKRIAELEARKRNGGEPKPCRPTYLVDGIC